MSRPAAKLSVSVPAELADAVRRRVGAHGLSSFVARAMAHELEREQLGNFLDELEKAQDPVSKKELAKARRAWQASWSPDVLPRAGRSAEPGFQVQWLEIASVWVITGEMLGRKMSPRPPSLWHRPSAEIMVVSW